jgi:hypothetical protein
MPARTYRVIYKRDPLSLKWSVAAKTFDSIVDAKKLLQYLGEEAVIMPTENFERIGTSLIDGCHSLHRHDRRREAEVM